MRPTLVTLAAVSCGLACLASVVRAAQQSDRLTASDEFEIRVALDPQISPDGKRIVYVRQSADRMTDRRNFNLWIVNADGSGHRPLTSGNQVDSSPRWSPDGTRVAYVSSAEGRPQIYIRWIDSGQTARITNVTEAPGGISWSPDGNYLAFSALVPDKGPQIAQLPPPPPGAQWAEPPTAYDRLVYRANFVGYLKHGFRQLFLVSAEGGAVRQLTSGDLPNGGSVGPTPLAWSPDGQYLLASVNRHPDSDRKFSDSDVYEFSVADGSARALTRRDGPDQSPVVSPNGRWIAYVGFDERHLSHATTRLYVMNRDGSGSRSLSDSLDRDAQNPQWAPDSSGIYFQYDDRGTTQLGYLTLDGKLRKVADHIAAAQYNYGSYGGGSFSVARSGSIALTFGTATVPGDVGVWSHGAVRVVTSLNRDLLAQKPLGRVEEIEYESGKDRRKIQGWVLYPPDFDPARKYPLILEIHGGPFANYGDRFDFEKQVWAAMGYVVLFVNPRGSTSYGEEFANLIHHAYPGDDLYDLESGVDTLLARGFIDKNNLFVTGGSGGGILTCWMIEHTSRYRAAASLYPVINWYSFILTVDYPAEIQNWFPALPWENPEEYMRRSPISYVSKVATPLLLMTGEEDHRTPLSETEQFYRALKLLNVETVMVRVPGEAHQIVNRPSHHMAKILYVAGWFEKHKARP
jgi:acylaminoacyl-peptidase